jgi:hypothetical protein
MMENRSQNNGISNRLNDGKRLLDRSEEGKQEGHSVGTDVNNFINIAASGLRMIDEEEGGVATESTGASNDKNKRDLWWNMMRMPSENEDIDLEQGVESFEDVNSIVSSGDFMSSIASGRSRFSERLGTPR